MGWLIALAAAAVAVAALHPRYGAWAWWRARRLRLRREQVEDALKYLVTQEQNGRHASLDTLAGVLRLSRSSALALITRMESEGLVESRGGGLHLTPAGERWALQVVRAHRLWERYLADEARMPLERIHREAERREHHMSPRDVAHLEALLGHPRHDPHGDPIPTPSGDLSAPHGTPLTAWPPDTPGRIVHLEDEPSIAYSQILAEGLRLGQVVRVLEKTPGRLLLSDGENEYRLAPAVAANVFVEPVAAAEPEGPPPGAVTLADLPPGAGAEVVALDRGCQGFTRRRLLDLGLTPGAVIVPEMQSLFGDPRAYRVRGTLVALRREQAERIWVRPLAEAAGDRPVR